MNKELLGKAIKSLAIQEVRLRESSIKMAENFEPRAPGYESLDVQYKSGPKKSYITHMKEKDSNDDIAILNVLFNGAYRLVVPGLAPEISSNQEEMIKNTLVEVEATFTAEYLITSNEIEEDSAAIDEFCIYNAGYHVWPYWREYAQSTAERLRVPRIVLPMYKIPDQTD